MSDRPFLCGALPRSDWCFATQPLNAQPRVNTPNGYESSVAPVSIQLGPALGRARNGTKALA